MKPIVIKPHPASSPMPPFDTKGVSFHPPIPPTRVEISAVTMILPGEMDYPKMTIMVKTNIAPQIQTKIMNPRAT